MSLGTVEIAAIASGVTGVISILATKGVDAYLKWRASESAIEQAARLAANADSDADDARADKAYRDIIKIHERDREAQNKRIDEQQKHIVTLEIEIGDLRKSFDRRERENKAEREECERITKSLQSQIDLLMRDKTSREAAGE